jgi:hypothetical protein
MHTWDASRPMTGLRSTAKGRGLVEADSIQIEAGPAGCVGCVGGVGHVTVA